MAFNLHETNISQTLTGSILVPMIVVEPVMTV